MLGSPTGCRAVGNTTHRICGSKDCLLGRRRLQGTQQAVLLAYQVCRASKETHEQAVW
jgi:hypothetical protein